MNFCRVLYADDVPPAHELASLWKAIGRYTEADSLLRSALATRVALLAEDHVLRLVYIGARMRPSNAERNGER